MKIPLSQRLLACCGFVRPGDRVADVGCDHGYLGIHLLKSGIADGVICSDVAEGPLQSAMRNAVKYGVRDRMRFFLSDGVRNIPRDFDCMVCAGMGADTMISILAAAPWLKDERYRLILQCQSKRPELRRWLYEEGYAIRRETLARDGKFLYTVMEACYDPTQSITEAECYVTRQLLEDNHPLLPEYLERVCHGLRLTAEGMARSEDPRKAHYDDILRELENWKERLDDHSS